jgi:competence protein ComGC
MPGAPESVVKPAGAHDNHAPGKRRGIRLVEALIVVGIIGILSAVTLCACGPPFDYTSRAKCSEAILACAELKTQIAEFAIKNGRLPASLSELNAPAAVKSPHVKSFELRRDASIFLRLQGAKEIDSRAVVLRPSLAETGVSWKCDSPDTALYKHLPAECRTQLE